MPAAHRVEIDLLRGIAILAVLANHAARTIASGGYLGVDVFFVVSGFLITTHIVGQVASGKFTLLNFFKRRIRRLIPPLLIMLVFVLGFGKMYLLETEYQQVATHAMAACGMVINFLLARDIGYFDANAHDTPLIHLWSLAVEEQFYLVWPAILLIALKTSIGRALAVAVCLGVTSFAWAVYSAQEDPIAAYYSIFTRFWELIAGSLLALWMFRPRAELTGSSAAARQPLPGWMRSRAAAGLGLALMCGSFVGFDQLSATPGPATAVPVIGAMLVTAAGEKALFLPSLLSRFLAFAGRISFPLYLWHWPILSFAAMASIDDLVANRSLRVAAVGLSMLLAYWTHVFVERPVRKISLDGWFVPGQLLTLAAVFGLAVFLPTVPPGLKSTAMARDPFAWPQSLRASYACLDRNRLPRRLYSQSLCLESRPGKETEILVIGDSHAAALWPALVHANPAAAVTMLGGSGCSYFYLMPQYREEGQGQKAATICRELYSKIRRELERNPRQVYLSSRVLPLFQHNVDYASREEYKFKSTDVIRMLSTARSDVIVVLQPPELSFSVRRCFHMRLTDFGRTLNVACREPRPDENSVDAAFRDTTRRAVELFNSPRIRLVDLAAGVCDEHFCFGVRDGVALYRDDNHLTEEGAKYVWRRASATR